MLPYQLTRPLQIAFLLLLVVSCAQVGWWIVDQFAYTAEVRSAQRRAYDADALAARALLRTGTGWTDVHRLYPHLRLGPGSAVSVAPDVLRDLDHERFHRLNRYAWEGGFFYLRGGRNDRGNLWRVPLSEKTLQVTGHELTMIIWDLAGEDELVDLRTSYLRGSSGYLVVADGTRTNTLDTAVKLQKKAQEMLGDVPFVFLLNKTDRAKEWALDEQSIQTLERRGWPVVRTSAKSNVGVQESFEMLAQKLMQSHEGAA